MTPTPDLSALQRIWKTIRKLWTPILIGEGEKIPRWYGCSIWIPFDKQFEQPKPGAGVYRWRRVYYPIPVNLVLATFYWSRHFLKVGYAVPPHYYRTYVFEMRDRCPHCHGDIYPKYE